MNLPSSPHITVQKALYLEYVITATHTQSFYMITKPDSIISFSFSLYILSITCNGSYILCSLTFSGYIYLQTFPVLSNWLPRHYDENRQDIDSLFTDNLQYDLVNFVITLVSSLSCIAALLSFKNTLRY